MANDLAALLGVNVPAPASGSAPDYRQMVTAAAERNGVPADLAHRLITQESGYNPEARSNKGAIGLGQLMPATARDLGVDPTDPEQNIEGSMRYLRQQMDTFQNPRLAVAAYNAGPGAVQQYGDVPPFPETQAYVNAILGDQQPDQLAGVLGIRLTPQEAPSTAAAPSRAGFEQLYAPEGVAAPPASQGSRLRYRNNVPEDYPADIAGKEITEGQDLTYRQLLSQGAIDPNQPIGSIRNPAVLPEGTQPSQDMAHGFWYLDPSGQMVEHKTETGAKAQADVERGLAQEDRTVFRPLFNGFQSEEAGARSQDRSRALLHGYTFGGADELAAAGRYAVTGAKNLLGVGPGYSAREAYDARLSGEAERRAAYEEAHPIENLALQVGGGALNPLTYSGGRFISGAPGSNLITQAARGALVGGGTGAVSGALMAAPGERVEGGETGATAGAMLGGAFPVLERAGVGAFNTLTGRNRLLRGIPNAAEQGAVLSAAENLPVPVPLTQGQVTGSAAMQATENELLKGVRGTAAQRIMEGAQQEATSALQENIPGIAREVAGTPIARGEGGAAASGRLNELRDQARQAYKDAYKVAEEAQGGFLPSEERPVLNQQLRDAVKTFDLDLTPGVKRALDGLDIGPNTQFTPAEILDTRARLSTLRQGGSNDREAQAASRVIGAIDGYLDSALNSDLISGDEGAVKAWKEAIASRREFGRVFEGNDLVQALTHREPRSGQMVLTVAPDAAAEYIFSRNNLGPVGRQNLARDLKRLRDVIGEDSPEWAALRGEAFLHVARAARGTAEEGGQSAFSGQKFANAWRTFKEDSPQVAQMMFSPEERRLIDNFTDVALRATVPAKGAVNASNTAIALMRAFKPWVNPGTTIGTGAGFAVGNVPGAVVGANIGKVLDGFLSELRAMQAASKAVSGKPIVRSANRLLTAPAIPVGAASSNRLTQSNVPQPAMAQ